MKCTLCGFEFSTKDGSVFGGSASGGNEKYAQTACSKCRLVKDCGLIKCPNCGFEVIPDPEWIKKLKDKRRKNDVIR